MNNLPEGYPLRSKDSIGNNLKENDFVRILEIPNWLVHDMDSESRVLIESCKNKVMQIYEIDNYGYAWFETVSVDTDTEYMSEKFCLEPRLLEKREST